MPTDNLFIIVLFIIPASIYILFNRFLRFVPIIQKDKSVLFSSALLFSITVFIINLIVIGDNYTTFVMQETVFDNNSLLVHIIIINIIISFILNILWSCAYHLLFIKIINLINKIFGRQEESKHENMKGYLFEEGETHFGFIKGLFNLFGKKTKKKVTSKQKHIIDLNFCILTLEKDGIKTSGMLAGYSSPTSEISDFLLHNVNEIEKILARDNTLMEEDKILYKIDYVYYDTTNNLKITFYNPERYNKYK